MFLYEYFQRASNANSRVFFMYCVLSNFPMENNMFSIFRNVKINGQLI